MKRFSRPLHSYVGQPTVMYRDIGSLVAPNANAAVATVILPSMHIPTYIVQPGVTGPTWMHVVHGRAAQHTVLEPRPITWGRP